MAKQIAHLSTKDGRHYLRIRVPLDLVQHVGKPEVSQALGDVTKAQAKVAARELSSQWSAHFLDEWSPPGLRCQPACGPDARRPAPPDSA